MLKINTVTMEEKIVEILFKTMVVNTEIEQCTKELLDLFDVIKSLPNDKEVKAHVDTLPYYGTCTTEYNEGFEDGIKWVKEQLAK